MELFEYEQTRKMQWTSKGEAIVDEGGIKLREEDGKETFGGVEVTSTDESGSLSARTRKKRRRERRVFKTGKTEKIDFVLGGELGSEEEDKEKIENRRNSSPTSTVTLIQMLYWFLMITDNS